MRSSVFCINIILGITSQLSPTKFLVLENLCSWRYEPLNVITTSLFPCHIWTPGTWPRNQTYYFFFQKLVILLYWSKKYSYFLKWTPWVFSMQGNTSLNTFQPPCILPPFKAKILLSLIFETVFHCCVIMKCTAGQLPYSRVDPPKYLSKWHRIPLFENIFVKIILSFNYSVRLYFKTWFF